MRYLFVGLALLVATPASARYGYCTASHNRAVSFEPTGQHFPQILSGILDFGEDSQHLPTAEQQFNAFLRKNSGDCNAGYDTVEKATEARNRRIQFSRGTDTDTGWTGTFAATITAPTKAKSSGAFISIKDNGIAARLAAWEDALLQARREAAASKVEIALATAQSKVEYQRVLAKAKAEAKKRGRMQ